jgi:hypothetical protein
VKINTPSLKNQSQFKEMGFLQQKLCYRTKKEDACLVNETLQDKGYKQAYKV